MATIIQVEWDPSKKGERAAVQAGGSRVDFHCNPRFDASIRGAEPLPSTGAVRWRLRLCEVERADVAYFFFGICCGGFGSWSGNPAGRMGAWVWEAGLRDGHMYAENILLGGDNSKWTAPPGSCVEVLYDADARRVAFELDSVPLEGFEGFQLPPGTTLYPLLGCGGTDALVESMPPPAEVPLQVFAQGHEGVVAFVCVTMGGEELGRVSGLGTEDTGAALASRVLAAVPAPPGARWRLVLLDGSLLEKDRLLLPLRELLGCDQAAGDVDAQPGSAEDVDACLADISEVETRTAERAEVTTADA